MIPLAKPGGAAAQDRHALGDERDLLPSANWLPMAVFAGRGVPAAFDRLGIELIDRIDRLPSVPPVDAGKNPAADSESEDS